MRLDYYHTGNAKEERFSVDRAGRPMGPLRSGAAPFALRAVTGAVCPFGL